MEEELVELQEFEAARVLLLLAHEQETIAEEELLLIFALDEEQRQGRKKVDVVTLGPRFNFDVQTDADCITMCRFRKEDIRRLAVLLQLPATTTSRNRTTWSAEEGLCIVLRRLAYPCRLTDLVRIFGRWMQEVSVIVNTVCQQICSTWMHL